MKKLFIVALLNVWVAISQAQYFSQDEWNANFREVVRYTIDQHFLMTAKNLIESHQYFSKSLSEQVAILAFIKNRLIAINEQSAESLFLKDAEKEIFLLSLETHNLHASFQFETESWERLIKKSNYICSDSHIQFFSSDVHLAGLVNLQERLKYINTNIEEAQKHGNPNAYFFVAMSTVNPQPAKSYNPNSKDGKKNDASMGSMLPPNETWYQGSIYPDNFLNTGPSEPVKQVIVGVSMAAGAIVGLKLGGSIGTAIFPGVGTAIGAAVGAIVGCIVVSLFGNPVKEEIQNMQKEIGKITLAAELIDEKQSFQIVKDSCNRFVKTNEFSEIFSSVEQKNRILIQEINGIKFEIESLIKLSEDTKKQFILDYESVFVPAVLSNLELSSSKYFENKERLHQESKIFVNERIVPTLKALMNRPLNTAESRADKILDEGRLVDVVFEADDKYIPTQYYSFSSDEVDAEKFVPRSYWEQMSPVIRNSLRSTKKTGGKN